MESRKRCKNVRLTAHAGFTLVELLVVITIIGILVALLSVAAAAAIKRGRQTAIKTELDQISVGIEDYKNDVAGSYPPNLQIDDNLETGTEPAATPINESQVLADLRRHMKQAYPKHREPDDLLRVLAGLQPSNDSNFPNVLEGGMTAGEAIVFWLSGFSSDPKYPISGEGGPSYLIEDFSETDSAQLDPVENRRWVFPFEVARLEPRNTDGYFDESDNRFIEYGVTVNGEDQTRRINFWQYVPRNSTQPYLYFDTSRHGASEIQNGDVVAPGDPPASTAASNELHVHALKKVNSTWTIATDGDVPPTVFVNPDKFQILHAGVDDEWGEAFELTSVHEIGSTDPVDYLLYPNGPFTGEVADTIVNFSDRTLEDSQP